MARFGAENAIVTTKGSGPAVRLVESKNAVHEFKVRKSERKLSLPAETESLPHETSKYQALAAYQSTSSLSDHAPDPLS